jgi:lipopolysaccharide export system protein LptA
MESISLQRSGVVASRTRLRSLAAIAAVFCTAIAPLRALAQQHEQVNAPATAPAKLRTGLVTIESDQQTADQRTGVVTAIGTVRIVYPDERVVVTARQAQYFSNESRVVLSGDVDIVQEGGNLMRAEQVVYLVDADRLIAVPPSGAQVFSRVLMPQDPSVSEPAAAQP